MTKPEIVIHLATEHCATQITRTRSARSHLLWTRMLRSLSDVPGMIAECDGDPVRFEKRIESLVIEDDQNEDRGSHSG